MNEQKTIALDDLLGMSAPKKQEESKNALDDLLGMSSPPIK